MKKRPICVIEGCKREALVLFAGQWICGPCLVEYDRRVKEQQFNKLKEVLKDANSDLS